MLAMLAMLTMLTVFVSVYVETPSPVSADFFNIKTLFKYKQSCILIEFCFLWINLLICDPDKFLSSVLITFYIWETQQLA